MSEEKQIKIESVYSPVKNVEMTEEEYLAAKESAEKGIALACYEYFEACKSKKAEAANKNITD